MNNKIKMIVMDLDGTLLDNDKNISNYSINVLNKCKSLGIKIVFATARPIRATRVYYKYFEPEIIICHNGAEILIHNESVFQNGILPEIYDEIINNLNKLFHEYNIGIEIDDNLYSNFDPNIYWKGIEYKNITDKPNKIADKILIGPNDINDLVKIETIIPKDLYFEIDRDSLGLIMNKSATKLNGIKYLQKHFKLKEENIITFGDDINDLGMIKYYNGVIVENAIDQLKENCKNICESNNNNGVAKWIEKNIL
jgi:Cof subfamily protein (haloacid dehalogenase superfamily)